jgi:lipoprotein-anchoring transpeptidase ErfK/SrfK
MERLSNTTRTIDAELAGALRQRGRLWTTVLEEHQPDAPLEQRLHFAATALESQDEQLEELRIANAELTTVADAIEHRIHALEQELQERDRMLAGSQAQSIETESLRSDRASLQAELADARSQGSALAERLRSEVAGFDQQRAHLAARLEGAEYEAARWLQECQRLVERATRADDAAHASEIQIRDLSVRLCEALEQRIPALEAQIEERDRLLTEQREASAAERARLRAENARMQTELAEAQQQPVRLRTSLLEEEQRSATLEQRLHGVEAALESRREELEDARVVNADLTTVADAIEYRIKTLEHEIQERDRMLADSKVQFEQRKTALETHIEEQDRLLAERREASATVLAQSRAKSVRMRTELAEARQQQVGTKNRWAIWRTRLQHLLLIALMCAAVTVPMWPGARTLYTVPDHVTEPPKAAEPAESFESAQVAPPVEPPPHAESADDLAREAEHLFEAGDVAAAARAGQEATRVEPGVARHHRLLGYIHAGLGAEREATTDFSRAAELEPGVNVSLVDYHLARARVELGEELRHHPADSALADRARALAAVEINPELKAISRVARSGLPLPALEFVPPITLTDRGASALVVEKGTQTARAYGLRGGQLVVLASYPVTTGETPGGKQRQGDRRTPDGIYAITDLLPGDTLPERYGALALPLSYPNAWDQGRNHGGGGIWIHGTDRLSTPFSSRGTRGCVHMREEDLREIANLADPFITPVLLAEDAPYVRLSDWNETVRQLFEQVPVDGLLNLVAGSDYIVVTRQDGGIVVRDFLRPTAPWQLITSERTPAMLPSARAQKLAQIRPPITTWLVSVQVHDSDPSQAIVLETSAPAKAKGFRRESADRFSLDLPGVKSEALPETVDGNGSWVKQVRIAAAADVDAPTTRIVVEMRQPATLHISSSGNRTILSLSNG